MANPIITFIGAGNMASAIISGLIKNGYPSSNINVSEPRTGKTSKLKDKFNIKTFTSNQRAVKDANIIVFAVKPQIMSDVCHDLKDINLNDKLVISIAAGVKCTTIENSCQQPLSIIRAMPNTPALIGYGSTAFFANTNATPAQIKMAEIIFNAIGNSYQLKSEKLINAVTAASGSSPAYFFLIIDAMIKTAISQGIEPSIAKKLVVETALGATKMIQEDPNTSISTLKENVTSKGGTTAAALNVFNRADICSIVENAMLAAHDRAQEMENLFK